MKIIFNLLLFYMTLVEDAAMHIMYILKHLLISSIHPSNICFPYCNPCHQSVSILSKHSLQLFLS